MNRKTIGPQVLPSAGVRGREGNHLGLPLLTDYPARRIITPGHSTELRCSLWALQTRWTPSIGNKHSKWKPTGQADTDGYQEKSAESKVLHNLLYRISTKVAWASCGNSLRVQNSQVQFWGLHFKHYINLTSLKMEASVKGGQLCGERWN